MEKTFPAKKLVVLGLMLALTIVLLRLLVIVTPIVRISLGFIPVALVATLYGPFWAAAVFGIADFLGALFILPTGPWFWGFTVTAAISGFILGLFLYKRPKNWFFTLAPTLIICLGLTLVLDTYFLYAFFEQGFIAMIPGRIIKTAVMIPVYVIVLRFIQTKFDKVKESLHL